MCVGDGEGGIADRLVIRSDLNKAEMKSHLEWTEKTHGILDAELATECRITQRNAEVSRRVT